MCTSFVTLDRGPGPVGAACWRSGHGGIGTSARPYAGAPVQRFDPDSWQDEGYQPYVTCTEMTLAMKNTIKSWPPVGQSKERIYARHGKMRSLRIVPVVVRDAKDALPTANALLAGIST